MDPPPPGAPKEFTHSSYTVTGGTGAFFGARGYWDAPQDSVSGERRTTDCEDPAFARAGRREDAEKVVRDISPLLNQAEVFACLGDKERTLDALDRSVVAGPFRIGRVLNDEEFAFLRGDPQLKALRKKVGLPN